MAASEVPTTSVDAIRFGFFTDEEVRKHSFVKVTSPILFDDSTLAKRVVRQHIHARVIVVILTLFCQLIIPCCSTFFTNFYKEPVEKHVSRLKLIMKGDVLGAKRLESDSPSEYSDCNGSGNHIDNDSKQQGWTSLQFTEIMSVLDKALPTHGKECKNCKAKNPKISKPTFGWFQMSGSDHARENVLRGCNLEGPLTGQDEEASMLEDENFNNVATRMQKGQGSKVLSEFFKQKNSLSGDLLPTEVMEHPQTVLLSKVLEANVSLSQTLTNLEHSRTIRRWRDLQESISVMFNSKTAAGQGQRDAAPGICQLLEKKEGLFRQKMMGKRVNFACRSVISPDPYLAVNEIGIPPYFATRLTYPERVTPWNVDKLRNAIVNGSEIHPGATQYVDKSGPKILRQNRRERISISRKLPSSKGAVMQHGKGSDNDIESKIVHRHLRDGDIVLVNRQPTLHKPSIMAHVVRVLKGEKTIRMHYANCSTYNADFDGDEMNVHFPQDEISRSEAYNIVNANNQYVKPTSGDPIRALIQDHVISAVLLTKKDTFLRWDQFNQLLYSSCVSARVSDAFSGKPDKKVSMFNSEGTMQPLLPAIWKPERLWTGKQVITALLNHITRGSPPVTVERDAKIPRGFFNCKNVEGEDNSGKDGQQKKRKPSKEQATDKDNSKEKEEPDENHLLIYRNNLVRGVIDKAQFGDYGLVHTVQEFYGSDTAGKLLSVLSHLFTVYLQTHGFTCGIDDLLLLESKDAKMKDQLESCEDVGENVYRDFIEVKDVKRKDPVELQLNIENFIRSNGESALASLDRRMISQLNNKTSNSDVFKQLLLRGLSKPSVKNCIYLMTTSGAKGSVANLQQITSYLGQQELEGKRVPQMISGKTLPCFPPWDWSSRAGGFIIDRFLTGLHPQEYYFHCMAGREGLVDTAVKTSRSGYLQRCIIKNLECLKVSYDNTVRDADGSIIQFRYGEDGIDVHMTSFIQKFESLIANKEMFHKKGRRQMDKLNPYIKDLPLALKEKAEKFVHNLALKEKDQNFQEDFLKLMEHKYLCSLAQPGEPVGVLAGQSVGEPSTQMTLNTFHLAGRGEMNVTLGIPRLQEILMTAANDIKTPVMTCPLQKGRLKEEAQQLADKLKKITVADIIESMKVTFVPFSIQDGQTCRIYKLEMTLHIPEHLQTIVEYSSEDWEEILEIVFVRELEDAIQNHILLLSKISGIKNFMPDSQPKASNGTDENRSEKRSQHEEEDDDNGGADDGEHGEGVEDFGLDAHKRKLQATDEMDYEDGCDDEVREADLSDGDESEIDEEESEVEMGKDDEIGVIDASDEMPGSPLEEAGDLAKPKSKEKKTKSGTQIRKKRKVRAEMVKKETDRAIFVSAKGFHFEVHFRFTDNEPHILLSQIAQKTAQKVYIQRSGKVADCKQITCDENQVLCFGKDPENKQSFSSKEKKEMAALQTTGIDFGTFWKLQDVLDVRHLTLIADFMTHAGGYRPLNRFGGIVESISPFNKMTFETASKFIVEAAYHGQV
ncbi:hypothetical protein ACE6H2_023686 [Prunus campanulata]